MGIGQNLMTARKKKGLSQEDVANTLDVSRHSVSLWECDQTIPSLDNLISLSKLYNTSIDILTRQKPFEDDKYSFINSNEDKELQEAAIRLSYKRLLITAICFASFSLFVFWVPGLATIVTGLTILFSILSMRRIKTNKNLLTLIIGITLFVASIFCYINFQTIINMFGEVFI